MRTVAIHLIWTTYMTWPPGDARGHWSPLFDFYGHLIASGHHLNLPDPTTMHHSHSVAKEPVKLLNHAERQLIGDVLGDHLVPSAHPGQGRGYVKTPLPFSPPRCLAAAIEANHVHLLIGPCEENIDRFAGRLKGRTSSELKKLPVNTQRQKIWTEGYWKVFLFDEEAVRAVRRYIEAHNERSNPAPSPYEWIVPT